LYGHLKWPAAAQEVVLFAPWIFEAIIFLEMRKKSIHQLGYIQIQLDK
jgi:hypothetical protein